MLPNGATKCLQSRTAYSSCNSFLPGLHTMQVDSVAGLAANHLLRKQADGEGVKPRPRMVRVGKELASLSVSLLCHGFHLYQLPSSPRI